MTKVAIWCRHEGDNLIGIGRNIPWKIPSDTQFFLDVVDEQDVVMGRKTYESLPGKTLPNSSIWLLSRNKKYELTDKKQHQVVTDIRDFKDFEGDLYIAGGAGVYEAFLTGAPKLMPDIIVDCVYAGEIFSDLKGEAITITPCIDVMKKKYFKITDDYERDGVKAALWVKRGDFVEQSVLRSLKDLLEKR